MGKWVGDELIEPWRKQLRTRALEGRCFETLDQLPEVLDEPLLVINLEAGRPAFPIRPD